MTYETLLRDAQYFFDQAEENSGSGSRTSVRFSIASIVFSFMAIESFINNMMSDFASLPEGLFTIHEQGFLAERAVAFSASGTNVGRFEVTNRREYKSLEEKILFLVTRFSGNTVDKGSSLWQKFQRAKEVRDRLTHPRKDVTTEPDPSDAQNALEVAKEVIKLVSGQVWGKSVKL